jgi:HPt (histidine-containing phosphotransfer) domain-containing protein
VETEPLPIVDFEQALAAVHGDEDAAKELVDLFLSGVNKMTAAVADTLPNGKAGFAAACHELGTSLAIVGGVRAAKVARRLERSLYDGEVVDLVAASRELIDELQLVVSMLRVYSGR